VQLPRTPMGRTDGFGKELLPDCRVIQRLIDGLRGKALVVQVGSGDPLFRFTGIDVDLANKTTVAELVDVALAANGFLGYVSFIVPLAESLGKPALLVWSSAGLKARQPYVRQITPRKVLHCKTSRHVMDDAPEQEVMESLNAIC
jgi:ADP-heptose:LPS heptosyltransferase